MTRRIVDLSHPVREGMTTYPRPWHVRAGLERLATVKTTGRAASRLTIGTHTGTHVDAPAHFLEGGATIESLDLDVLVGPCRVLDLSALAPGTAIGPELLSARLGADLPKRLILRFDWCGRYVDEDFYHGHPFLTPDAARLLVDGGVRLLGTDLPQLDTPPDLAPEGGPDSPIHKILLGGGVILVEYLRDLRRLTREDVELIVMPLRLEGADGSPARCVAVEHLD